MFNYAAVTRVSYTFFFLALGIAVFHHNDLLLIRDIGLVLRGSSVGGQTCLARLGSGGQINAERCVFSFDRLVTFDMLQLVVDLLG